MKNQLLAGTALVTAAVFAAGGATAQDKMKTMKPSISVNGYFESVVGGTLNEDIKHIVTGVDGNNKLKKSTNRAKDASALDVKTDAEIHFNGSATLDSGLKIHARVELEGMEEHADGDTIDEYFIAVSGSFGQIVLGGTEAAPTKMLGGFSGSFATGVGESLAFDLADWVPSAGGHFSTLQHARLTTNNGGSDDSEKLTYISPNFGGFQIGMSYVPRSANDDDNARVNAEAERHDGLAGAVSYSGKFGEVGIGGGAGYMAMQGCNDCTENKEDLSGWVVAGRLDFGGGFRTAIAYKRTEDAKADRGYVVDAGVRYVAGANQFSFVGSYGELEESTAAHTSLLGSYARSLGPGVKLHVNLVYVDSESAKKRKTNAQLLEADFAGDSPANVEDGTGVFQAKKSGVTLITGIKVVF